MTDQTTPFTVTLDEASDRSLPDDVRELVHNARQFAQAELAFQKSRVAYAGQELKAITIRGIAALVLVYFAVMGLVFGLILALAPILTPWGSTAAVCGLLLVAALILGFGALSRWKRMTRLIAGERDA